MLREREEELFGFSDSSTASAGNIVARKSHKTDEPHAAATTAHPRWFATSLHDMQQSIVESSSVVNFALPDDVPIKNVSVFMLARCARATRRTHTHHTRVEMHLVACVWEYGVFFSSQVGAWSTTLP